MITQLQSSNEINKLIRAQLIKQSGLDKSRVINALSIYGETLDKLLEDSVYNSYERSDVVCLFELQSNDQQVSFDENNTAVYLRSYEVRVILYGNASDDVATLTVARLRTEKVRQDLYEAGLRLRAVSEPIIVNEFKNGVMWLRTDFSILLDCEFSVKLTEQPIIFDDISDIKIIEEENDNDE